MEKSGIDQLRDLAPGAVLTIGNFDGVHLGHRELIRQARTVAGNHRVVTVTFDPHPATVLKPEAAPLRLTPQHVKTRLLKEAGADDVIVIPPIRQVLEMEAEDFFAILRDQARIAHLVEGENFCFGKGRRGTVSRLTEWTKDTPMGLTVLKPVEVALVDMNLVQVSSSLIRTLAAWGRVRDAGICLGSPLRLVGKVVEGFKRGRTLGFPTANLDCTGNVVPADGVYAGRITLGGTNYPVALNIGPLPTFSDKARQIEAHIIGFSGDLYGQTLEFELADFLRDTRKFPSLDALKSQLHLDIENAKERAAKPLHHPIAHP